MSPMPGIFDICEVSVLFISPAMANVCPSCSSTSVCVRRVEMAGTRKPSMVSALAKSSELTSGATFSLTRSVPTMVGVKVRRTPNSLNWIVTELRSPPPCTTGYGYSPPARKLASLPFSAIRFGSARLWKSPLFCSALMTPPTLFFASNRNRFSRSLNTTRPSSKTGAANCCVLVRPIHRSSSPLVKNEAPSSCSALRLTSAKRTRSSTWLLAMPSCWRSRLTTSSFFST